MIAVERLSLRAGAFAVDDLSFEVPTGEYAVLMGRTGTGKTTLLEAICGLKPIRAGSIRLLDVDVTHLKPAERGVGYVPQDLALFPTHTVRQHLGFSLEVRRRPQHAIDERVDELAELLGIRRLLDRRPLGLSGGEAQRVALGRALAFRPRILLLDEPLSALDDATRQEMYALLRSVQQRTAVTTLHVTHSLSEAKTLADRLLVLRDGKVELRGGGAMKVVVRYMAQLRQAAGVAAEEVELDGPATPAELLRRLAERRGEGLRRLLLTADGTPQPTLLVFVGDEQADVARDTLKDGDEVTLLSPIAGGQAV